MATKTSRRDPHRDIPKDANGDPIFVILPEGYRRTYDRAMARCEAAWLATGDPLIIDEAVVWTFSYRQPIPRWLQEALGQLLLERRTPEQAKRALDRAKKLMRYQAVRDAKKIDGLTWVKSRVRASKVLKRSFAAAKPGTMKKGYDEVIEDLREGRGGLYHTIKGAAAQTRPDTIVGCGATQDSRAVEQQGKSKAPDPRLGDGVGHIASPR
jgi:hypothetical protein